MYNYAVPITEQSLDLIATNNGGVRPEIDASPSNGEPTHYFVLPEDPNDHAEIMTADDLFYNYEFVGPNRLDKFFPIVPIGRGFAEMRLSFRQLHTENTTTVIVHVPVGTTEKEARAWLRMGFIQDFGPDSPHRRTLSQQLLHDRDQGLSEAQVAEKHNLTTVEVRTLLVTARSERRMSLTEQVRTAAEKNRWSNTEIAQSYGLTESEVRILLKGE